VPHDLFKFTTANENAGGPSSKRPEQRIKTNGPHGVPSKTRTFIHKGEARSFQSENDFGKPIVLQTVVIRLCTANSTLSQTSREITGKLAFLLLLMGPVRASSGRAVGNLLSGILFQLQGQHGNNAVGNLKGGLNVFPQILLGILQDLQQTRAVFPGGFQ